MLSLIGTHLSRGQLPVQQQENKWRKWPELLFPGHLLFDFNPLEIKKFVKIFTSQTSTINEAKFFKNIHEHGGKNPEVWKGLFISYIGNLGEKSWGKLLALLLISFAKAKGPQACCS